MVCFSRVTYTYYEAMLAAVVVADDDDVVVEFVALRISLFSENKQYCLIPILLK